MKKQILMFMLGILLLVSLVSAKVEFWQTQENVARNDSSIVNGTMKNHIFVLFNQENYLAPLGTTPSFNFNFVTGNKPYEFYLIYDFYVNSWNTNNPSYAFDYCNFTINYYPHLANIPVALLSKTFTANDTDIHNVKFYVRLYEQETMIADVYCVLQNKSQNTNLLMPSEVSIGSATQNCKACQMYEWSVQEADITKAQVIGDNATSIMNYIYKLFEINFEILLAFFWIFIILMVFVVISFIFMGVYWLFVYLRGIAK